MPEFTNRPLRRNSTVLVAFIVLGTLVLGCKKETLQNRASTTNVTTTTLDLQIKDPTSTVVDLSGNPVELLRAPIDLGLVIIFTRTDCPVGNRYAPTIAKLHSKYSNQDIQFALVYPDPDESALDIRQHLKEYGLALEAYRDPHRVLVKQCEATITPEAVVFDRSEKIVYRGRIDNRVAALGKERPRATKHDLREVLEAITGGETVEFHSKKAFGCFIE